MALSRVTTWSTGQVLTASALNGEFNNILDTALSLISPLTGNLDFNGNSLLNLARGSAGAPGLYFSSDSNTGIFSSAADVVDISAGGVRGLQIASTTSAVNFILATPAATAGAPTLQAGGTDTNINMRLMPKGTGYIGVRRGQTVGERIFPSLGITEEPVYDPTGLVQLVTGEISLVAGGRRVLQASAYANATNYLRVTPSQSGATVVVDIGSATTNNADLQLGAIGSGVVRVSTAFVAATVAATGSPPANSLHRENTPKGWLAYDQALASIYGSYNVTSVTDTSSGVFTINWDRDFAATTYSTVISVATVATSGNINYMPTVTTNKGVGTTDFAVFRDTNSTVVTEDAHVQVISQGLQ